MAYTEEMTTSEILLRLASMRNELLQAINDIEKISNNICYKAEQTEPQTSGTTYDIETSSVCKTKPQINYKKWETPPKFEHKGDITTCVSVPMALIEDELHIDC